MKIKQIIAENKPTMTGVPPRGEPQAYTTVRTQGTYGTKPGGTRTSTGGRVEKTDQGLRHTADVNNPNIKEEFNGISVDIEPELDYDVVYVDINGRRYDFNYWYADEKPTDELGFRKDIPQYLEREEWYNRLDQPTKMEVLHAVVQAELGNEPSEYKPTVGLEPRDVGDRLDEQGVAEGSSDDIEDTKQFKAAIALAKSQKAIRQAKDGKDAKYYADGTKVSPAEVARRAAERKAKKQGVAEAVTLDRGKNPNYPSDPKTIQHRIETAKAILNDPNSDASSRREASAIISKLEKKSISENKSGGWSVRSLSPDDSSWAISRVVKTDGGKFKSETHPKKFRSREAAETEAKKLNSQAGVAEGHADQQRQIIKKNGQPVGEVGIDRESSPGAGMYYMKHYASGLDLGGYDSREEAMDELRYAIKQSVAEGMLDDASKSDSPVAQAITRGILLRRTDLIGKYGLEKVSAAVREVADFVGDVDEIGSSDMSGWIREVEQQLGNMQQDVAEDTKKDACYRKVKSRYKVWPSAYASGALVKCRQVGAANWGNKSKKK